MLLAFVAGTCRGLVQVPAPEVVGKKYYLGHYVRVLVDSYTVWEKPRQAEIVVNSTTWANIYIYIYHISSKFPLLFQMDTVRRVCVGVCVHLLTVVFPSTLTHARANAILHPPSHSTCKSTPQADYSPRSTFIFKRLSTISLPNASLEYASGFLRPCL